MVYFFKPKYCIEEREILTHFGLFVAHSLVYAFAGLDNAAWCAKLTNMRFASAGWQKLREWRSPKSLDLDENFNT